MCVRIQLHTKYRGDYIIALLSELHWDSEPAHRMLVGMPRAFRTELFSRLPNPEHIVALRRGPRISWGKIPTGRKGIVHYAPDFGFCPCWLGGRRCYPRTGPIGLEERDKLGRFYEFGVRVCPRSNPSQNILSHQNSKEIGQRGSGDCGKEKMTRWLETFQDQVGVRFRELRP